MKLKEVTITAEFDEDILVESIKIRLQLLFRQSLSFCRMAGVVVHVWQHYRL